MLHTRNRALMGAAVLAVRADTSDPKVILAELNKGFEEFKKTHADQLKEIKAGIKDVVTNDKLEKINGEITTLSNLLDTATKKIAAMQVGGQGDNKKSADAVAHEKAFNSFFRKGNDLGASAMRELEVKASLSTLSDPDGGYVVPEEMEAGIDRILVNADSMRTLARVQQIGTNLYKRLITLTGATSGWVGETESRPELPAPKLAALEFPVFELYANPAATQTLLDDASIDIAQWLGDEVSLEFSLQEGAAWVSGNGVNQPRGFTTYTNVLNSSWAWGSVGYVKTGTAADFSATVPADALIDLIHSLRPGFRQNGVFQMNDLTLAKIRKFKDTTGQYLWQPSLQVGKPSSLLGYPVESNDFMSDVGANAFPVAFADWKRFYLIIDRIGIRVLRDPFTNKPYVMFYTTKRVGGGVQNFQAGKLLKMEV